MSSPQLQELSEQLQALDAHRESVEAEIEALRAEQREIDEATDAIESLESGSTVQVPLGGGAYVRATIDEIDELIVGVGAGYAAERGQEGAIETLETRKGSIDDQIEELREEIEAVEEDIDALEAQASQLQQQAQQQLQQQMQGMQGGEPDA
jgi:prefoldin alpha subunit